MRTAVVLNLPEHGHMNATFPVIAALAERGERIIYYATEPFRKQIEDAGAIFAPYPQPFVPPIHTGGLYSVMAFLMEYAGQTLPALIEDLRNHRPDYLLLDSMCVWGALAKRILDLPAVMLASVFVPNPERIPVSQMVAQAYGQAPMEVILEGIAALDRYLQTSQRIDHRYGVVSPDLVNFFANRQALNIVFTSREFHLAGESYDPSYRFAGPSITPRPSLPPPPLEGSGPLLYISLGTIFNNQPAFYRTCVQAFEESDYRVILSTGAQVDHASLGPIPANFHLAPSVNQLAVLEHASLFLTHGGMNSVSEALWHGVPLLVFPQHGDQHIVAARVCELGAGIRLTPADIQPERLRNLATQALTDPRYRTGAGKIAESFRRTGGPQFAAGEILDYAASACSVRKQCLLSA